MRLAVFISAALSLLPLQAAKAWWDEGHMQIAYVAYKHLDPSVKAEIDALLKLNKDYPKWIAGAADPATAKL